MEKFKQMVTSEKGVKIIGIVTTVIGFGLTLVSDWADDKKLDSKIRDEVNTQLEIAMENNLLKGE